MNTGKWLLATLQEYGAMILFAIIVVVLYIECLGPVNYP